MKEIGFWDYTCPGHGSLEYYTESDWDRLIDDMAAGGFNSLVLGIKWVTTGYRSRLPWLDQDESVAAIASDNATLYHALDKARQAGLRVRLLIVATIFNNEKFGGSNPAAPYGSPGGESSSYDLDYLGINDRICELFAEVVDLFGSKIDGLVVELEFCDHEAPHRVAGYNQWARENGRPSFEQIKNVRLEPRSYPFADWRDFTTHSRIKTFNQIESTVRGMGFTGELSSIIELVREPMAMLGAVNLEMLSSALPDWPVVSYDHDYDRRQHRLATMDFCIHTPHRHGLKVCWLTRGVMTFRTLVQEPPTDLREQWAMSIQDAQAHRPEVLWFMGSDARADGWVCSDVKLPAWGFEDGRTARLHLMKMVRDAGLAAGV